MYNRISDIMVRVARLERLARVVEEKEFLDHFVGAVRLSNVDPEIAEYLVEAGDQNSDKISVVKKQVLGVSLKPSQTTMVVPMSISWAIKFLSGQSDLDLGALISEDGYIMDGHHRWSAAVLAYGSGVKIEGYVADDLKGVNLLRVLNIVSKGKFGVRNGNQGKGSISSYTPQNIHREVLNFAREGDKHYTPDFVVRVLEDNFGSVENAASVMAQNSNLLIKDLPRWAPDRVDMPVISSSEAVETAQDLSAGKVKWQPPYRKVNL